MDDSNRERSAATKDEIDRTGRDEPVTGTDANQGFGAAGSKPERRDGLSENDAPENGVDSADFSGAGAP